MLWMWTPSLGDLYEQEKTTLSIFQPYIYQGPWFHIYFSNWQSSHCIEFSSAASWGFFFFLSFLYIFLIFIQPQVYVRALISRAIYSMSYTGIAYMVVSGFVVANYDYYWLSNDYQTLLINLVNLALLFQLMPWTIRE